jgi:hypothetical protein
MRILSIAIAVLCAASCGGKSESDGSAPSKTSPDVDGTGGTAMQPMEVELPESSTGGHLSYEEEAFNGCKVNFPNRHLKCVPYDGAPNGGAGGGPDSRDCPPVSEVDFGACGVHDCTTWQMPQVNKEGECCYDVGLAECR